ncbi:MAG: tRNA (adenosine(37)-N6)-threonylcarbamoyltransferase complex ATPase subunit type 1 TsaE [Chloroflexota bacterium]
MTLPTTTAGTRTVRLRTTSATATRDLGAALAAVARPGDRIALLGPLGAGKTQLAKGFGAGLGVTDEVTSPSFTLMNEHTGRLPLFHLDLYRLAGSADAVAGGMLDEREDEGVTLIEWAERLDATLDADRLDLRIRPVDDETRDIVLEAAPGGRYERYLDAAERWAAADARRGAR